MATTEQEIWKELRKPFDAKVIGKIPKGGVQLDYVGHAAVTDRLLSVDPTWTWEPVALDERGLPQYDNAGGLWIKLTVGGVTRLGYGDGPDPKQRIGDALRNAAMRFGVALDLWTKDELESHLEAPELKNVKPTSAADMPVENHPDDKEFRPSNNGVEPVTLTPSQIAEIMDITKKKGYATKQEAVSFLNTQSGLPDFRQLSPAEYPNFKTLIIQSGWSKSGAKSADAADAIGTAL